MYRDAPLEGPACYKHAAAPAAATCLLCDRTLCEPCVVYDLSTVHCIDCARRARRRRSLVAAAKIAAVVTALAGGVISVMLRPPTETTTLNPHLAALRHKVLAERCDKRATLEYEEALLADTQWRAALADSDEFFGKCGDWYRLRWVRYGAHEHLNEHAAAIDEATRLIAHDPTDHDYYWWRGIAYEELGNDDAAIADYKKTLQLLPSADRIPFNLANVLERHDRFCEARQPILQFVAHHPELATNRRVVEQLERLRVLGRCASAQ